MRHERRLRVQSGWCLQRVGRVSGETMSSRAELLNRVNSSEASPFLLCNLLGRRARQLAIGEHAALMPELINVALRQFLEGSLKYEANGARPHSAAVAAAAGAVVNEIGAARKGR